MLFVKKILLPLFLILFSSHSFCASMDEDIYKLRTAWAMAKYETPKNKQIPMLEQLVDEAKELNKKYPNQPDIMVWYATTLSTLGAVEGKVRALPNLKKAKDLLEDAIKRNPNVENGFAQGVLGALYARVPGWPISFGNKDKAREHLEMAVKLSPNGVDSNYYYGDFLIEDGKFEAAKQHLELAEKSPIRPGYEIQDRGRKVEVATSLLKLKRLGH